MFTAVFAPQTAPPDVLVRRLRPYLASGDASLRRVAAATLRHVCERDASAVLRSVHMTHASGSDGSRSRIGKGVLTPRGVGGGLEADLLALLDGYGGGNEGSGRLADDDGYAVRDATRALWLLTGANAFDDPAKAARRLAAVALHAPGRDWGGDELEGGDEVAEGGAEGAEGDDEGRGAEGAEGEPSNAEGDDSDAEDERGVRGGNGSDETGGKRVRRRRPRRAEALDACHRRGDDLGRPFLRLRASRAPRPRPRATEPRRSMALRAGGRARGFGSQAGDVRVRSR